MFWIDENEDTWSPPKYANKPNNDRSCPVCKSHLGIQEVGMEVSLHCNDCKATYTFFPGIEKPISKLDKDKVKLCNCNGCRARRGDVD